MNILNLFRNHQSAASIAQAPESELDEQVLLNVNGGHGHDSYNCYREYHRGGDHRGYGHRGYEHHEHCGRRRDDDCD
ncbi:hypothetical protein KDW_51250 [Dictyobacter vulcani]|uniref:Uncharacterized protein n=1 Tax=Dictyobacter vulcani TaxID=2607529 RepID=A0A5J4KTI0_9CHLR|nr:hypothetical protein [Dictyobacter vulcani]GER90963.1 hypothetical protein KDW_51250 [Dictyobacter vulcani]